MFDDAYRILGIEPTTDARVIRKAYVRLARIYHPDRFVGMPDDVRLEAERRMKEVTTAYQSLRAAKKGAVAKPAETPPMRRRKKDPWEEVKRVREEAAQRRRELEESRVRWLLWEELERQARERAEYEATLVTLDDDALISIRHTPEPTDDNAPAESLLVRRLKAAQGSSQTDRLAPR